MPQTFVVTPCEYVGHRYFNVECPERGRIATGSYNLPLVESREALADLARVIQKYLIENPPEPE